MKKYLLVIVLLLGVGGAMGLTKPISYEAEFRRLLIGPGGEMLAVVQNRGVYRSVDSGAHWQRVFKHRYPVLLRHAKGPLLIADGKIHRTGNFGKTWRHDGAFDEEDRGSLSWLAEFHTQDWVFYTDTNGSYFKCQVESGRLKIGRHGGKLVRSVETPDGCSQAAGNDKQIYVVGKQGGIYRSDDEGNGWKLVHSWTKEQTNRQPRLFVGRDGVLYASSNVEVFESRDMGVTWHRQTFGLPPGSWVSLYRSLPDALYLRDHSVPGLEKTVVLRSVDGQSATPIQFGLLPFTAWYDIVAGKQEALYIVTEKAIYKGDINGKNWEPLPRDGIDWDREAE